MGSVGPPEPNGPEFSAHNAAWYVSEMWLQLDDERRDQWSDALSAVHGTLTMLSTISGVLPGEDLRDVLVRHLAQVAGKTDSKGIMRPVEQVLVAAGAEILDSDADNRWAWVEFVGPQNAIEWLRSLGTALGPEEHSGAALQATVDVNLEDFDTCSIRLRIDTASVGRLADAIATFYRATK